MKPELLKKLNNEMLKAIKHKKVLCLNTDERNKIKEVLKKAT